MKVLYLHQYFTFPSGASGTRSYEFAKELIENGHHVTMLCGTTDTGDTRIEKKEKKSVYRQTVDGIDIVEIDLAYSNSDGFYKRVYKFIKFSFIASKFSLTEDYDIAYATSTPLTIAIPALLARVLRFKPYFFEVRDLWPETPIAMKMLNNPILIGLARLLEKLSYFFSREIIALSPGMEEGVRKISKRRTSLIPNGCDNELFIPVENKDRSLFKCSDDDFVCVFTGAHGKANGLDFIINVAKESANKDQKIKFVLIGHGSEQKRLVAESKRLDLTNIIFLDPIAKKQLAAVLPNADVGLMILEDIKEFQYGTSPNKFFDYLSSGLPVVVNHQGWVQDLVTENNCGYANGSYDPSKFLKLLMDIKSDKNLQSKMAKNSRQLAEKSFDRKDLAKKFRTCIEGYSV